jgi:hypothetical protein
LALRLAALYAFPALLASGAYGAASVAHDPVDDWGSTHPDCSPGAARFTTDCFETRVERGAAVS